MTQGRQPRISPASTLTALASLLAGIAALTASVRFDADPRIIMACALIILIALPVSIFLAISWKISKIDRLHARKLRLPSAAALTATLILSGYLLLVSLLDAAIERRLPNDSFAGCEKIWSTRGLVRGPDADTVAAGNNPESILRAFEHGARGVEIDMFFDTDMQAYVVSHDRPYELKNGSLLTLQELLQHEKLSTMWSERYIWVDLKKLRHLSRPDAKAAATVLRRNVQAANLPAEHVYVEGADPVNLGAFRDAGLRTVFDTYPLPDEDLLSGLAANIFKAIYYFGDFTVMSFNYDMDGEVVYGPDFRETLGSIPLFVYHVPDEPALLQELARLPQVRVILDHDQQADRFSITDCTSDD